MSSFTSLEPRTGIANPAFPCFVPSLLRSLLSARLWYPRQN